MQYDVEMMKTSFATVAAATALVALIDACSSADDAAPVATEAGVDSAKRQPPPFFDGEADAACDPGALPGFEAPAWTPPAPFGADACTNDALQMVVSCYFDTKADQGKCDAFFNEPVNAACIACVVTENTTAELGPVVLTGNAGYLNVAGCLANVLGDTGPKSCAAKYLALSRCQQDSCGQNCTGTGAVAVAMFEACVEKASTSVCAAFAGPAKCAEAAMAPGGPAEKCTRGLDFLRDGLALGKLFCTGARTGRDAGADAAKDAPADAPKGG